MHELPDPTVAAALARQLLGPRYERTALVARRAAEIAPAVPAGDQDLLVVAAWWHDLGSVPELVRSGFPPIDGALYLAEQGHPPRLCGLVAHHGAAIYEAEERGLSAMTADWPREQGAVPDALWAAGEAAHDPDPAAEPTNRARSDVDAAIARTNDRLTVRRPGRPPRPRRR